MRVLRSMAILALALQACTGTNTTHDVAGNDATLDTMGGDVVDAGRVCTVDNDCSDHVFCNGAEQCAPGSKNADVHGCVAASTRPCTASETCNESTMRCESSCADLDGDGHGGMPCGDDCDDHDPERFPGHAEVCAFDSAAGVRVDPTHDEDCDPNTFANATSHDGDQDGDMHVDRACCNPDGSGGFHCGDDCADLAPVDAVAPFTAPVAAASIHPTQAEVCNGVDDNCNGTTDEGLPVNSFAPDCDGDNYGDMNATTARSCSSDAFPPCNGHPVVPNTGDCNDSNPGVHAGAAEACDGLHIDENCNGQANESCPCSGSETQPCCFGRGTQTCSSGAWGACSTPPVTEVCNATDDDCNGVVDDLPGATCVSGTSRNDAICGVYPCDELCGSDCHWAGTCTLATTARMYTAPANVQVNGGSVPCGSGLTGVCSGGASWSSFWMFAPNPSLPLPPGVYTASVGAAIGSSNCDVTVHPIVTFVGGTWSGESLAAPQTLHFAAGTIGSQSAMFTIASSPSGVRPCVYNMTFELRGTGSCDFFRMIDFALVRSDSSLNLGSL